MTTREEKLGDYVASKLREGDARMTSIEKSVDDLREEVKRNNELGLQTRSDVSQLLEIMQAFHGLVKVGRWFGIFIKWVAGIGVAVGLIYTWWKNL